ncbi:MAG: DUF1801 domain-containing protein [Planctomycetes bacterium]|nr:DUF1801 domain-containing protein [Planctomycetota bacterium]
MKHAASTVEDYLAALPPDRREALEAMRKVILANKDALLQEGMQYGMIGYAVPHSVYPDGYHCDPKQPLPFASIASQKNHFALYVFCMNGREDVEAWFREEWKKTGKKLDMGKGCIRFKKFEDVPLDLIGALFRRAKVSDFIEYYEATLKTGSKRKKSSAKKKSAKVAKVKQVKKAKTTKAAKSKKSAKAKKAR